MHKGWRLAVWLTPPILVIVAWHRVLGTAGLPLFGEFPATLNPLFTANALLHGWVSYLGFGFSPIGWPEALGGGTAFGTMPISTQAFWLLWRTLFTVFGAGRANMIYILLGSMLPFWGMWLFASDLFRRQKFGLFGAYAAALFYMMNPQVVIRTIVGTYRYHYAHALLPVIWWAFYRAERSAGSKRWLYLLITVASIGVVATIVPHFLVLLAPTMAVEIILRWVINRDGVLLWARIKRLLSVCIAGVGLLFGPLLAAKLWPGDLITPLGQFFSLSSLSLGGPQADIGSRMLRLFGTSDLGAVKWYALVLWLLPILTLVGAALTKRRLAWFWLAIVVLTVFMATGINPPAADLKTWIMLHLPGMSAFRDPSKFLELAQIGYALLLGWFFIGALERRWLGADTALITMLLLNILWATPWVSGNFNNRVKVIAVPAAYSGPLPAGRLATSTAPGYLGDLKWYKEAGGDSSTQESPLAFITPHPGSEVVSVATPRNNRSYRFINYWINLSQLPDQTATFNWLATAAATNQLLDDRQGFTVSTLPNTNTDKVIASSHVLITTGSWRTFDHLAAGNASPLIPLIFSQDINSDAFQQLSSLPGVSLFFDQTTESDLAADLLQHEWAIETNKYTWNGLRPKNEWMMAESLADDWQKLGVFYTSGHSLVGDTGADLTVPLQPTNHPTLTTESWLLIRVLEEGRPFELSLTTAAGEQLIKEKVDNHFVGNYEKAAEGESTWYSVALPANSRADQLRLRVISGTVTIDGLAVVPNDIYAQTLSQIDQAESQVPVYKDVADLTAINETSPIASQTEPGKVVLAATPQANQWLFVRESYHPLWRFGETAPYVADGWAQLYPPSTAGDTQSIYFIPENGYHNLMLANLVAWLVLLGTMVFIGIKIRRDENK